MKFLVLGDLHGRFPKGLKKFVKEHNPDNIIYLGDFSDDDAIRKLMFKHWTSKNWWNDIGVKKAEEMYKKSFASGIRLLKQLDSFNIPIYLVFGNGDFYKTSYWAKNAKQKKGYPKNPGYIEDEVKSFKNIVLIHKKIVSVNGFYLAGYGGYVDPTIWLKKGAIEEKPEEHKKRVKRYYKLSNDVKFVFKNFKGKNLIFVTHWPPYNMKFDKIINKESKMDGRHIGFEPFSQIDRKYKPLLHLCGHMHEHQGKTNIGKTIVVNPGYGCEGKAAVIELSDSKPKIERIKFVRIK